MSYPASLTTRTVKGRFVTYPDGMPATGSVRFVLNDYMQGPTDDAFIAPFDVTLTLDRNGEFSVVLPATNDPQWTGSSFKVVITTNKNNPIRTTMAVPYNDTADIDLADVLNLPAPIPGQAYILAATRGVANGVATLGSDGKVPSSQLPTGSGGEGGSSAFLWNGTAYVESDSAVYIGPTDPKTTDSPTSGTIWYVTDESIIGDGGQITDGQRVTGTGQVGYLGATHSTDRTLNVGDTIPSELTGCVWDDTVLRLNVGHDNFTIDNWHINAGIDCYSAGLTVMNCVIVPAEASAFYGVLARAGALTVQDTTIQGAGGVGESGQCIAVDGAGVLTVKRCDLSGFQDAIGIQNGLISQVYIHDIALAGSFHSDGIQIFGGGSSGTTVEHSLIDITGPASASTDGVHQNACVYTDAPSGPTTGVTINNCQLNGGAYEVILSAAPQDVHITNCDFGPVDSSGFGKISITTGTDIVEWSNNHDSSGTLMSQPSA
jgi:hypothetical protein